MAGNASAHDSTGAPSEGGEEEPEDTAQGAGEDASRATASPALPTDLTEEQRRHLDKGEEDARTSLEAARTWLARAESGEAPREEAESQARSCLEWAVRERVQAAVRAFDAAEPIEGYLERGDVAAILADMVALKPLCPETFTGVAPVLVFAAWLLRRWSLGEQVFRSFEPNDGRSEVTRFWEAYRLGLSSMIDGEPREPVVPKKPRAHQPLWLLQLALIQAYVRGADPDPPAAALEAEFGRAARNHRLDSRGIDPGGRGAPVRFNVPLDAIRRAAAHYRPSR